MKKLINFPQFTVKEIRPKDDEFLVLGSFNQSHKVTLGERYWLIKNEECYIGDLCEFDQNEKTVAFNFLQEQSEQIRLMETYACITSYWNWNFMETIINPETRWTNEIFQPKDAQVFYLPNGLRGWCEFGKKIDKDATIGEVIKNGWDHEDCEICNAKVGVGGKAECYKHKWFWLCVSCFNKYALNHDLSFTDDF